jgi:hypothetical protein
MFNLSIYLIAVISDQSIQKCQKTLEDKKMKGGNVQLSMAGDMTAVVSKDKYHDMV